MSKLRAAVGSGRYLRIGNVEKRSIDETGRLELRFNGQTLGGKFQKVTLSLDRHDQREIARWVAEAHFEHAKGAELARANLESSFHDAVCKR